MSHELLPCPFCGSEAKRITLQDEENFGGDVIICQNCDACSRVVFGEKEGLVEAWNRRATQPAAAHGDEAVRKDEWMPIKTAPLDGTEILLCRGPRVSSGAWIKWSSSDSVHDSTGAYLGLVEYASGADWGSWDGGFTEEEPPTHWMPLPAAMRAQGDGEATP